jgi:DNA-binding transcriptional ArsR family regulator
MGLPYYVPIQEEEIMKEQNQERVHLHLLAAVLARLIHNYEVPPEVTRDWPKYWQNVAAQLPKLVGHPIQREMLLRHLIAEHPDKDEIIHAVRTTRADTDVEAILNRLHGISGLISASDLLRKDFPEPVWAVPGILPAGLGILAGMAKLGKSWLALQMAKAVASGGEVLGTKVEQGPVLYLALEDSQETLQERMRIQGWPEVGNPPVDFLTIGKFYDQVGDLRAGGAEKLTWEIEHRGYRLTIIDTLSRAITGDQSDIREMTNWLSPIQEVGHETHSAILLIDHHRKGGLFKSDVVQDILGSTAKGAIADTSLGLYRERRKALSRLEVTGRRGVERALSLRFENGLWHYLGEVEEEEDDGLTEREGEIIHLLKANGSMNGSTIAREIGLDKGNTHRWLKGLVEARLIERNSQGRMVFYTISKDGDKPTQTTQLDNPHREEEVNEYIFN